MKNGHPLGHESRKVKFMDDIMLKMFRIGKVAIYPFVGVYKSRVSIY